MTAVAYEPLALDVELPWHSSAEQEKRFKGLLKKVLIPFVLLFLAIPWLPVMDIAQDTFVKERVKAKVLLDPPEIIPEPIKPIPAPKVNTAIPKTQKTKPDAKPKEGTTNGKKGVAAFSKQLSALRSSLDVSKLQNKNVFTSNSGEAKKSTRALLGKESATKKSGGLSVSDVSVNARGVALASHQSTDIESPIMAIELPDNAEYHYDDSKTSKRDMESIRITIERYKGSVYALYTKALRKNPELSGKFRFQFVVNADGSVQGLKLVTSELNNKSLETRMLNKIEGINFGRADVSATAVQYTFVFLPS